MPETLPKGSYFLRPGEVSRKIGFVCQGVSHYFQGDDDQELTHYFGRLVAEALFVDVRCRPGPKAAWRW
ncbi:MAG: hypothetical protein ACRYFX_14275 [Janthinobacterium lividum]